MLSKYAVNLENVHKPTAVSLVDVDDMKALFPKKSSVVILVTDPDSATAKNQTLAIKGDINLRVFSGDHTEIQRLVTPPDVVKSGKKLYSFQMIPMPDSFPFVIVVDEDGIRHRLAVNKTASKWFSGKFCNGILYGPVALLHKEFMYRSGDTDYDTDQSD